jgi:hypothetical protein
MKSITKTLVKIEVCRNALGGLSSTSEASTLLWMADELDNVFRKIPKSTKDLNRASSFINTNAIAINSKVPETVTSLFLIVSIGYIFGGLQDTNKAKYFEPLLEACLELDNATGGERAIEQRRLACIFADNLDCLINNG